MGVFFCLSVTLLSVYMLTPLLPLTPLSWHPIFCSFITHLLPLITSLPTSCPLPSFSPSSFPLPSLLPPLSRPLLPPPLFPGGQMGQFTTYERGQNLAATMAEGLADETLPAPASRRHTDARSLSLPHHATTVLRPHFASRSKYKKASVLLLK